MIGNWIWIEQETNNNNNNKMGDDKQMNKWFGKWNENERRWSNENLYSNEDIFVFLRKRTRLFDYINSIYIILASVQFRLLLDVNQPTNVLCCEKNKIARTKILKTDQQAE